MSQLSSRDIKNALTAPWKERLFVTPLFQHSIGESSVDLRLGNQFIVTKKANTPYIGAESNIPIHAQRTQERLYIEKGRAFYLHPSEFVLGCSLEYVRLPRTLAALVTSRSSWGRVGLVIATATAIGPGYKGVITLELTNVSHTPICLFPGLRIAQIIFFRLETAAGEYQGKYACLIGPEYSKITADVDADFWKKRS